MWLALIGAITTTLIGCSAVAGESEGRALLRRAGSVAYPDQYTFVDRPDAPGLQRCFSDEVEVAVAVDRVAGAASITRLGSVRTVAVVADGLAWVDASTVTDGRRTGWIEISDDDSADVRDLLMQAIGPSVATYLVPFGVPDSPAVTATGARESASTIERLDNGTVNAVIDRLASIDDDATLDSTGDTEELAFVTNFAFDDAGRVISIAARPSADATQASGDDEDPFGYIVDYDWTASRPVDRPDPATVTPVNAVVDEIVVPIRSAFECSIGG